MTKNIVKKLFIKLGFEVKRYNLNTSQLALMERSLEYHHIHIVFDVGANCEDYCKLIKCSLSHESLFTKLF
jgi:hypothetical protein